MSVNRCFRLVVFLSALLLCGAARAAPAPSRITNDLGQHGAPAAARDGGCATFVAWHAVRSETQSDIFVRRVADDPKSASSWPDRDIVVCADRGDQLHPVVISDGSGGTFVAWEDYGAERSSIHALHLLADGNRSSSGQPIAVSRANQLAPQVASDGSGGAWVAWEEVRDSDLHVLVQHLLPDGSRDRSWPASGWSISSSAGDQRSPRLASDPSGELYIVWSDRREDDGWALYAQRILRSGGADPAWPKNGRRLSAPGGDADDAAVLTDASGALLVAWSERRSESSDVYAQRVLPSGELDPAWPENGVAVCAAAGRQSSPAVALDASQTLLVAWQDERRSGDERIYASAVRAGARPPGWPENGLAVCAAAFGRQVLPGIALDQESGAIVVWQQWSDDFTPSVRCARVMTSGIADATWPPEGLAVGSDAAEAPLLIAGGSDALALWNSLGAVWAGRIGVRGPVGGPAVLVLAFAPPSPNPARDRVMFRFSLPTKEHTRLDVFDLLGRRIAKLEDAIFEPGAHERRWDLRDGQGNAIHSGVYFARLVVGNRTLVQRVVALRQ